MSNNPLSDAVDAQPEREREGAADALGEATGQHETKRLNMEVPKPLHRAFKQACKRRRTSMTFVTERLIKKWLEDPSGTA